MRTKSYVILIIFMIPLSLAIQAGISPPQLIFSGEINEELCNSITLYSQGVLVGEDKWSLQHSKNLGDYHLTSNYFGINIEYTQIVNINDNRSVNVCIEAKKLGTYYGALIYSQNHVGVGIWITLNIRGDSEKVVQENLSKEDSSILTGATTGNPNRIINIIYIEIFILVVCLTFLIIFYKRKHLN